MGLASASNTQQQIEISNMTARQTWLAQIAQWHHDEWCRANMDTKTCPDAIANKLSEREKALTRHLDSEPLPITFVAHFGERPIGTVSIVYYQFTNSYEPTEWLTNLFVLPEYRRRGIASLLLMRALDHARHHGLERLLLYTNDQVAFYRKRRWRSINQGLVQGQKVEIMDYVLRGTSA